MLVDLAAGDRLAVEAVFPRVYAEMRRLAATCFKRQNAAHTLQPTALVHEAYIKLADGSGPPIRDRRHFFMLAAKVMRQILVDHARARNALKRRRPGPRETLIEIAEDEARRRLDVLDLEQALEKLATLDPQRAHLVELRYFGGLTSEEAAEVLGVSRTQAARWWRMSRAWLASELSRGDAR